MYTEKTLLLPLALSFYIALEASAVIAQKACQKMQMKSIRICKTPGFQWLKLENIVIEGCSFFVQFVILPKMDNIGKKKSIYKSQTPISQEANMPVS